MSDLNKTPAPQKERPKRIKAPAGSFKEKTLWQRIRETFFAKTAKDVGNYLWNEVMVPAFKRLLVDSVNYAANEAIYGDDKAKYRNFIPQQTHVSQSSVYSGRAYANQRQYDRSNRYNSILKGSLECSNENVLHMIIDDANEFMHNRNGKLSVKDFESLLPDELSFPVVYTDDYWGWTNPFTHACVVPTPKGYILDLPPARQLT